MALRDYVLNNFRWKLTALSLAMLVWFVIEVGYYRGTSAVHDQILSAQPVMVLKAPEDLRAFRVRPSQVNLVVKGTKDLSTGDLEVFVDLTKMPDVEGGLSQVQVRGADAAEVIEVKPRWVRVERVVPGQLPAVNSPKKP
jgi:hypothetical protein